jgi:transcriptional regulator
MAQKYEAALPEQWSLSGPDPDYLERMTKGTIGFEIAIEQLEGKWKLSQNYPVERRLGIIAGLRSIGSPSAEQVAELMLATCTPE